MKPNIILDLDNTLICAEVLKRFPFNTPGMREKALQFGLHNMDGYYIIFERPHLRKFISFCLQHFNVLIFTAGTKDYGLFIIEKILKPYGLIPDYYFFSYHCELSHKLYKNHKDLNILFEYLDIDSDINNTNTILIDDHPDACEHQPDLTINIKAFNFMDKQSIKDEELLNVMNLLKKKFNID